MVSLGAYRHKLELNRIYSKFYKIRRVTNERTYFEVEGYTFSILTEYYDPKQFSRLGFDSMGCLKQFLRKGPAPVVEIVATVKQPKTIQQSKQPRKKMRWAPQPKPRQEDVDWQKVAREEKKRTPIYAKQED